MLDLVNRFLMEEFNFNDPNCYDMAIQNSNVVINLVGSRYNKKSVS